VKARCSPPLIGERATSRQQGAVSRSSLISDPCRSGGCSPTSCSISMPFLAGALYLGVVFPEGARRPVTGSTRRLVAPGLCGLAVLLALYVFTPDDIIMAPLLLWLAAACCGFVSLGGRHGVMAIVGAAILRRPRALRGAAGARHPQARGVGLQGRSPTPQVPRNQRTYERPRRSATWSLFLLVPALRTGPVRHAAFNLKNMPANAYLGMYLDSEGPSGINQGPAAEETPYFRYLPMFYPYVLKAGAGDVRGGSSARPVDGDRAEIRVESRHCGRGQPRGADGVPRGQGTARFHGDVLHNPRSGPSTMTAALPCQYKNRYDVIDCRWPIRPACRARRLPDRREVSYTREAMEAICAP